jgi:hypothetical protein
MKIKQYLIYTILLYFVFVIISNEYSIIEHIKKDTIVNPNSGRNLVNVGDWKFVTAKNEPCEHSIYPLCDKMFIEDPNGSKVLLREIESDVLDKKYSHDE